MIINSLCCYVYLFFVYEGNVIRNFCACSELTLSLIVRVSIKETMEQGTKSPVFGKPKNSLKSIIAC